MPATTSHRALLCAAIVAATGTVSAQERAMSLEDTLATLFACSPAFRIHAERTRRAEAGSLRAAGAFDVVASAAMQAQRGLMTDAVGVMTDASYSDVELRVGLGAMTRANIAVQIIGSTPLVSSIDLTASPIQPLVRGSLSIPLLKLGRAAAFGAEERASMLHADAVGELQKDAESELASRLAEAYWRWVASHEQLKLTRTLEKLALDQVTEVDQLIAAHARAPADRLAIVAAGANATATRVQAEQLVFEQQQLLWNILGLPAPAAPLVPGELPLVPSSVDLTRVAHRAHELAGARPLFKSFSDEADGLAVRVDAARIGKRPDLNLVAEASATRVVSASWDPLSMMAPDMRLGYYGAVGLQFSLPLQNRAARGALAEASAAHAEIALSSEQRRNAIEVDIDALSAALATLTRTYQERMTAATQFRLAYDAQRARFRMGTATTMDVVIAEQQYMSASLATVADAMGYAVALARLQHESGALNDAVKARDAAATARALTNPTF